jgi:hypothetical protein
MKHSDENPLLKEILTDEKLSALRRGSLNLGLDAVRRARRLRRALHAGTFALMPVLLILTLTLRKPKQEPASQPSTPVPRQASVATAPPNESGVKIISDEELFALFPGRSLALVGKPGHQQLVFLDASAGHY